MSSVPKRKNQYSELEDMKKRLARLERMTNLVSASIGSGGVVIRNGGDLTIEGEGTLRLLNPDGTGYNLVVGGIELGGTPIGRGAIFRTDDGRLIAIFASNEIDDSSWASIYDARGNEVLAIDRNTGYGLAYPYHHYPFIKNDVAEYFVTTSAAYVLSYTGWASLSNPDLEIGISATVGGGAATGQIQIKADGVVVAAAQSFSGPSFLTFVINADQLPGATPGKIAQIQIEMRRTAGAGNVLCQPEYMVGRRNI